MRRTLCALALTLALGCSVMAREILCPPVTSPPPPQATQEATMEGEIQIPLIELALTLLGLL